MNEVKTLNKKIEEFCKSKNLALISDVNQNCLANKKLHLHKKGISSFVLSFKKLLLNEWQQNSDLGVGNDKITADHNLTNRKQNISQNVPEKFESDFNKLKVLNNCGKWFQSYNSLFKYKLTGRRSTSPS